jgi:uncharacterized protein YqgQ
MYIRRYGFLTVLFLILMGWAVYTFVTQGETGELAIYHNQYILPNMPIAIAIMIPAVLVFITSLGHLVFYGFINFLKNRADERELKKLEETIKMNLKRKETSSIQFNASHYRDIGELISVAKMHINSLEGIGKRNVFRPLVEKVIDLQNGRVLELESGSGFYLKEVSHFNSLKSQSGNPEEILLQHGYSDKLYIEAFNQLCKDASFQTIEKYEKWFNIEAFLNILKRVDAEENGLTLTLEMAFEFISKLTFSKENYLRMASVVKESNISPDFRIEFFKTLADKNEEAFESYLYTLLHLEMIEEVEDLIRDQSGDEFNHIKAYMLLKQADHTLLDIDFFFKR